MNELIELVKQWGVDKGITGPQGKGTLRAQAEKMREECDEAYDAALEVYYEDKLAVVRKVPTIKLKDGIGDLFVTGILLAELAGFTPEECLQHAYDEIKGRTGQMVGGQFVKDK